MLSDEQKRLYARQILVAELGMSGQAALCGARVQLATDAAPAARAVASEYLRRAGVRVAAADGCSELTALRADAPAAVDGEETTTGAMHVALATQTQLQTLAGDPLLEGCAAWLCGCLAAVEAIKQIAGVGSAAQLDPQLVLGKEVN